MLHRLIHYADVNARVRARLGAMPGEAAWREVAAATDVPNMLARMRAHGLDWWLTDLPRDADGAALEEHLDRRAAQLLARVGGWLPDTWRRVRDHLRLLPLLGPLRALLGADPMLAQLPEDSPLREFARLDEDARRDALAGSRWSALVDARAAPQELWWRQLPGTLPVVRGHEARMIARLVRTLRAHDEALQAQRVALHGAAVPHDGDIRQWALRAGLAGQVREVLNFGHPWHAGVVLCYVLLEALQFERMRAMLLGRANGWPVHVVMGA